MAGQPPKQFNANENITAVKILKRTLTMDFIRESATYKSYEIALRRNPDLIEVRGPDPSDVTLSKRKWESSVMKWRDQLKAATPNP
jgi:hypothetical protein